MKSGSTPSSNKSSQSLRRRRPQGRHCLHTPRHNLFNKSWTHSIHLQSLETVKNSPLHHSLIRHLEMRMNPGRIPLPCSGRRRSHHCGRHQNRIQCRNHITAPPNNNESPDSNPLLFHRRRIVPCEPLNTCAADRDRLNLDPRNQEPLTARIPLHGHHGRLLLLLVERHLESDGIIRIGCLSTLNCQRRGIPTKDNPVRGIRALLLAPHHKLLRLRIGHIARRQRDPPRRLKANIGQPLHLFAPYVVNSTRREGLVGDEVNLSELGRQFSCRIQRPVNPAIDEAAANRSGWRVPQRQNQLATDHLADARIPLDALDHREATTHIHPSYTISAEIQPWVGTANIES